ncbi:MAG: dapA4 [Herbinix sp.]|jgi:4-hydroxy-tetrahydrodipicolinate synthase|nr:dapA4 [Herbinix sp.]
MKINGVWLPIITPFKDDKIDFVSYRKLIDHYIGKGVHGIIPLGTTGECPVLNEREFEEMIEQTMTYVGGRVPVYVGVGGNYTAKVVKRVKIAEYYDIQGILSVCPYYNKPGQEGIYEHFKSIAEETDLNIVLYNIPYRTGVNMENDTVHRLAAIPNIIGIKDASGDFKQSMALLMNPPKDFSIMTGEDALFYNTLVMGGQGGILASAHLKTDLFLDVYKKAKENNAEAAFQSWKKLYDMIPLLFKEPNPSPVKYCLKEMGLIDSDEVRLPLTEISDSLKDKLNHAVLSKQDTKPTIVHFKHDDVTTHIRLQSSDDTVA